MLRVPPPIAARLAMQGGVGGVGVLVVYKTFAYRVLVVLSGLFRM